MHFEKFPKMPRLGNKRDEIIITEKVDGTNGQILIEADDYGNCMYVGSRNRWLNATKQGDNYGFYKWADENYDELLGLGPGRHYGEWWGQGIQRAYDKSDRTFSIFNTRRPADTLPDCVKQVPILYHGPNTPGAIKDTIADLWDQGSRLCDHWFKPEGVVIYFVALRQAMKFTYDYRDGKWGPKDVQHP